MNESARSEPVAGRSLARAQIEALWAESRRWVAAIILANMPHDADLDDLLQDVALKVVRSIDTLNDVNAYRSWVRTIAINTAKTVARKRRTRMKLFREAESLDQTHEGWSESHPDEIARQQDIERGRVLMELAQQLPPGYREPLILRCVQGMTQKQLAEAMDLPETTVETRLVRARRMLRDLMDNHEREEEQKRSGNFGPAAEQHRGAASPSKLPLQSP